MQAENQEEFQAFLALQSWLLTEFEDSKNERKLQEAKKSIQRICSYWAMHSKVRVDHVSDYCYSHHSQNTCTISHRH